MVKLTLYKNGKKDDTLEFNTPEEAVEFITQYTLERIQERGLMIEMQYDIMIYK